MPRRLALPGLLLALALAACGKQAELPGEPVDDSPTGQFLEALADAPDGAAELAVPGSPAARYVRFQADLGRARAESEVDLADVFVRRSAGGYLLCEEGDPPACAEVTDVRLEGAKVRGFKVDGAPISERVVIGSGRADVRLLSAYRQPTTERLWIVLEARRPVDLASVSYGTGQDGKGLRVLPAGDSDQGVVVLTVPGGRLGGSLRLVAGGEQMEIPVRR